MKLTNDQIDHLLFLYALYEKQESEMFDKCIMAGQYLDGVAHNINRAEANQMQDCLRKEKKHLECLTQKSRSYASTKYRRNYTWLRSG